jgi:hypothetical protein
MDLRINAIRLLFTKLTGLYQMLTLNRHFTNDENLLRSQAHYLNVTIIYTLQRILLDITRTNLEDHPQIALKYDQLIKTIQQYYTHNLPRLNETKTTT